MKNIIVTGGDGYIGNELIKKLFYLNYNITSIDINYYYDCYLASESKNKKINFKKKDIRLIDQKDIDGNDYIVHLAALSNDPLGEINSEVTYDINYRAAVNIAKIAKKSGIKRFIFISSQSAYGISDTDIELDEEAPKNPVTAYADSKLLAEKEILNLNDKDFNVLILRPSTIFGASNKLRCDIVFNNLVACGYTLNKIEIHSDGSPWRPVLHIKDLCNAIVAGLNCPLNLISGEIYNVGIKNGNYTVREIANVVSNALPESKLIFLNKEIDPRSYRVSFDKILTNLKNYFNPEWNLEKGAKELISFFDAVSFSKEDFLSKKCNRLKQISYLKSKEMIDKNLYKK